MKFISPLLLAFAAVVFLLIAVTAIDTDVLRWAAGAEAAFVAAFLPWGTLS